MGEGLFEVCAAVSAVRGVRAPFEGGRVDGAATGRAGGGEANSASGGLGIGAGNGGPCGLGGLRRLPLGRDGVAGRFPVPILGPFASAGGEGPEHGAENPKQDEGEEPGNETAFACGEEKQEEENPKGEKGSAGVASAEHGRLQGIRMAYFVLGEEIQGGTSYFCLRGFWSKGCG